MTITNAHTHLELGWLADYCPTVTGSDFVPWIVGLIERRIKLGDTWEPSVEAAVEAGIQALIDSGVTEVGDISLTGKSIGPLLESSLKGIVYVEVLGMKAEESDNILNRAIAIIDQWRPRERSDMRVGLTIHSPYSVHPTLWQKSLDYARREELPLCIHMAEGPDEFTFMTKGTGPLVEGYHRRFGGTEFPCPGVTPTRYLEDVGALALKPLLVHAVQVDDGDIERIKDSGSSVVHCPRSNLRLRCGRMPLELFMAYDVPVYLGTDSLSSSPSLNICDELEVAIALHYGKVKPEAIENLLHRPMPGIA